MRHVKKTGDGGYHLGKANEHPPTTPAKATSRWQSFGYKSTVSKYLQNDQYGLCAYSEIRPDIQGIGVHIEHIEPKSLTPIRTFDFHNLVLSALSSDDLSSMNKEDVFGGHAKLDTYDSAIFISCLDATCSEYFVYLFNGKVEPEINLSNPDKDKALSTIDLLNLNCPYLITLRKNWIEELDKLIDEHINKDMSLSYLAAVDLLPDGNNNLSQFFTATRQRFSGVAESLLSNDVPKLI